jgi:uncharacterized protein YecE (DUF72 family)
MANVRIGTVDIPERVDRDHYFKHLDYLELSAMFAGPFKQSSLAQWAELAPPGSIGLAAPFVLTHRNPPKSTKLWPHDARVGDFRDSVFGRQALTHVVESVKTLSAACVVFRSPPVFAPSAANRDVLRKFFSEVVPDVGAERVWVPDGLWEPRSAATFATELGITVAIDPLVFEPGQGPELYEGLEVPSLYLRVSGLGRPSPLGNERLDELAALVESYEETPVTIALDSPARWADAKNLTKLLKTESDSEEN